MPLSPPPCWEAVAYSSARAIGWLVSLITIMSLAFVARFWPNMAGATAPGLLGPAVALLTDSWQGIAMIVRQPSFPRMSPARCIALDMFSLGVSLGGVILVMLAWVNVPGSDDASQGASATGSGAADHRFTQQRMLRASMWLLTVVVILRLAFSAWACVHYIKSLRMPRTVVVWRDE